MTAKSNPYAPWPERDDELRTLWKMKDDQGNLLKKVEVAARMKLSKGAISGRALRLGLPLRGAPITNRVVRHSEPVVVVERPRTVGIPRGVPTLPPLPSLCMELPRISLQGNYINDSL